MPASPAHSRLGALGALWRYHYAWLLLSLLLLLVISALLEGQADNEITVAALWSLVLLTTVFSVSERPRQAIIAGTLAAAWLGLTWGTITGAAPKSQVAEHLLLIALNFFTIALIVRQIVTRGNAIDLNLLCGALGVYMLIGVVWAVTYDLIETVSPGSFDLPDDAPESRWNQLLYFSFATLTTLGYGDITPISPLARIWSVIEAMTGLLFVATMIARMVALLRR